MKDRLAIPQSATSDSRRLGWALAITGSFMVLEVIGGLISGSLALLADAGHMLTDTAALTLAWIAAHLTQRPTDSKRSYGYHRAQVLAAFVNALALLLVVGWILFEAVQRLMTPREVEGGTMLGIALLGLLANVAVLSVLHSREKSNINVAAARLHVIGDLLGSVSASVAAVVILTTGWMPIDALLSILVAMLILRSAWSLLRKSTLILMEHAPDSIDPDELRSTLIAGIAGVHDVHDVHCWSLTSGQIMVTLHLVMEPDAGPSHVLRQAKSVLADRFDVAHSALQIEHGDCPDEVH